MSPSSILMISLVIAASATIGCSSSEKLETEDDAKRPPPIELSGVWRSKDGLRKLRVLNDGRGVVSTTWLTKNGRPELTNFIGGKILSADKLQQSHPFGGHFVLVDQDEPFFGINLIKSSQEIPHVELMELNVQGDKIEKLYPVLSN